MENNQPIELVKFISVLEDKLKDVEDKVYASDLYSRD